MKSNASLAYNIFLVLGDLLALLVSFTVAFVIRASSPIAVANPMHASTYVLLFASLLPFWILIFALLGLYNSSIYERRFTEAGRLFVGSFIGLLFVVFWDYLSLHPIFPAKLVPVYGFLIGFVLLIIIRNITRTVRTLMFSYGRGLTRVVVIGNTPMTLEIINSLSDSRASGYTITGVIGYRKKLSRDMTSFANFEQFLASKPDDLHGIIQTELYPNERRNAEILSYAQENHVSYRFVPGNSELFVGNIDVDLFRNSIPVIHVHHTALFGWGRILKRLTDIILGSLVLIISLPLWLLCIVSIRLSGSGPIFYKASRYSRFGSKVGVYKFRTVKQAYNNMSPEAGFAKMGRPELAKMYRASGDQLADDPRFTRVGKFMRATSLDELPQIWNVVHGEISLVGPRALDVLEMEKYDKKNLILSVKSGLTGLAIVTGRHAMNFEERRKLDLYYVQNWSFWLDIVILLKTVRVVLERLFRHGSRYE
jgi:undecaprenyl-phosphate galactose phosphotransferase